MKKFLFLCLLVSFMQFKAYAVDIFTENFESGISVANWSLGDSTSLNGSDYWWDVTHKAHGGNASGWCAGVGTQQSDGSNNTSVWKYDNYMNAYMASKDIDINGYANVTLSFYYWVSTQPEDYITVFVKKNTDTTWHTISGFPVSDTNSSIGWRSSSTDITSYGPIVNIKFFFYSDSSGKEEGVYIDDIKITGTPLGSHTISKPNKPAGPEALDINETGTYTTGGAVDSWGHSVNYRFEWDSGNTSTYSSSTSASHSWAISGNHDVYSMARCTDANPVTSTWSDALTVTVPRPVTTVSVTVTTNIGSGTKVIVDGTETNAPYSATWTSGNTHSIGINSPQSAGTGKQYVFSSWSDSGSQTHNVTPTSNTTYTANLNTQYYLTVNTSPASLSTISGSGWYNSGASATTGTAPSTITSSGTTYSFTGWTVDGSSVTGNPITTTMNSAKTATANYISACSSPPSITTSSLPDGYVGTSYNQTLTVTSGTPSYTWSLLSGSIPGLSLSTAGVISGTPTTAGTYQFTVQVNDANNCTANKNLQIIINPSGGTARNVSIPATTGTGGSSVSIPINIDDASNIAGMDFTVSFDNTVLTPKDPAAETTTLTNGFTLSSNTGTGQIIISLAKSTAISSGNGSLVNMLFTVNSSVQSNTSTNLIFTNCKLNDVNGTEIPSQTSNGTFTVSQEKGDINGDNRVSSADAVLCLRIAVGLITPTSEQEWASDMNSDNQITSADAIKILRKAVGLD